MEKWCAADANKAIYKVTLIVGYVGNKNQLEAEIHQSLNIMASLNLSETGANEVTEKETSPFPSELINSPQKRNQRNASPEYDPKAGENRLRPAGGELFD